MKWIEAAVATKSEEIDAVCEQLAALGAGGISKRVYEDEGHIGRAPNVANIEHYITHMDEMIQRKRSLFEVG